MIGPFLLAAVVVAAVAAITLVSRRPRRVKRAAGAAAVPPAGQSTGGTAVPGDMDSGAREPFALDNPFTVGPPHDDGEARP